LLDFSVLKLRFVDCLATSARFARVFALDKAKCANFPQVAAIVY
jgi:hypothetical protein